MKKINKIDQKMAKMLKIKYKLTHNVKKISLKIESNRLKN